jgi:hypothetical protein
MSMSADGSLMAVGSTGGGGASVDVWRRGADSSWSLLGGCCFERGAVMPVSCVSVSPNGVYVAAVGVSGTVGLRGAVHDTHTCTSINVA